MIFATGSTYSQGTPAPDWMAPVMGVVIGLAIIAGGFLFLFLISARRRRSKKRERVLKSKDFDTRSL